jgi:hypothetical protein
MEAGGAFEDEVEIKNVEDPISKKILFDKKVGTSLLENERGQTVL